MHIITSLHRKHKNHLKHRLKYRHQYKVLDSIIVVFGVANGVATIPQVLEVWVGQDVSGLSLFTWSFWVVFSLLLLTYAIVHRQKTLIAAYSIGSSTYLAVLVGVIAFQ